MSTILVVVTFVLADDLHQYTFALHLVYDFVSAVSIFNVQDDELSFYALYRGTMCKIAECYGRLSSQEVATTCLV